IRWRSSPAHAGVVKGFVREVDPGVATPALAATLIQPQPVALAGVERADITGPETIRPAVAQKQYPLKACTRLCQVAGSDAVWKDGPKACRILLMPLQPLHRGGDARPHFGGAFDRLEGLFFQRRGPAVPEKCLAVRPVKQRRCIAMSRPAADACRQ